MKQQAPLTRRLDGPVAPDRRRRHSCRQDLLRELPHRDLVVVGRLAARHRDGARPRHHRRDQQRCHELRHRRPGRGAAGNLRRTPPARSCPVERPKRKKPAPAPPTAATNTRRETRVDSNMTGLLSYVRARVSSPPQCRESVEAPDTPALGGCICFAFARAVSVSRSTRSRRCSAGRCRRCEAPEDAVSRRDRPDHEHRARRGVRDPLGCAAQRRSR